MSGVQIGLGKNTRDESDGAKQSKTRLASRFARQGPRGKALMSGQVRAAQRLDPSRSQRYWAGEQYEARGTL